MFGRYLFLAILFFIVGAAESYASTLKIVIEPSGGAYSVRITFAGEPDGSTTVRLPNEWGGQRDLYKSIRNVSVSNGATLADTDKPFIKAITHKPSQKITVTYEIAQDFEGPLTNEIRYRPVSESTYIHWIGNTVWALPDWDDRTDVDVMIEWKGFPKAWTIANSFAAEKRKQKFHAKLQHVRAAVFVAGDFRLIETKAAGNAVNLAVRGEWQFKDAELAQMTRKIIETERDFFQDHTQKYYLVTLVPIDGGGPNSISTGGTGLTDSFALFSTSNARLDLFRRLLAHEYAHNWIPGKLVRMPAENEQAFYWFSEGFTDFYTLRLLHRGGLITRAEFVARYNELIREYYMSPVRTASNDRIVKDFWSDGHVQRLPYLRGFLFATNLDAGISRASEGKKSLDDLIHEMQLTPKDGSAEISFESLAATFTKHLGEDAMPGMKRYLIDGDPIVPASDALGSSVSQQTVEIPIFELGFDFDKFAKDRVVADLNPNSAAFAAGLRNGQQRTAGFSFMFGDTSKEIELKVKDRDGEKSVKFVPLARERAIIPQYRLN